MDPSQLDPSQIPAGMAPDGLESNFVDPPSMSDAYRGVIYSFVPLMFLFLLSRLFIRIRMLQVILIDDGRCQPLEAAQRASRGWPPFANQDFSHHISLLHTRRSKS